MEQHCVESIESISLEDNNGTESPCCGKILSDDTKNELENRDSCLKSLVPPDCSRKFENLQDYLLEVAKTLGHRQCFYSLDLADVLGKVQRLRDTLPSIQMFYEVKTNPDPVLLELLAMIGTSFNCSTDAEIRAVLSAGAPPSSILWAQTIKSVDSLQYARSVGVDAMAFDDEEELKKIHKVFPTARLFLRIRPSKVECMSDLSNEFVCSRSQVEHLLRLAKQLEMNVQGLSFHLGALCTNPDCFSATIRDCREIFEQAEGIGHRLSVLDIGGEFFGAKKTEANFPKIAKRITESLEEHFSDSKVQVIAEPGCYIVGSAMNLVCTVMEKLDVKRKGGVHKHYMFNNCTNRCFSDGIEDYDIRPRPLLTEFELKNRAESETMLYGQLCNAWIVIRKRGRLPDLEVGECLVWENMGAYSSTIFNDFCSVPLPVTVYVFDRNEGLRLNDPLLNDSVWEFLRRHAVFIGETALSE